MRSVLLRAIVIVGFLLARTGMLQGQEDKAKQSQDSAKKAIDSLHNEFLIGQSKQLQELEARRIADSLRQSELERQLSNLRAADNGKKQELSAELDRLKHEQSDRLKKKKDKIDSLRSFVGGYPVIPFLDTLFFVYSKLGSFSPKVRAAAITTRISSLSDDYFFRPDSLEVIPSEQTVDIVYGETIITSVSDNDALWMNMNKEELASIYQSRIGIAVQEYKKATSWPTLLKEIGLALLVIAVLSLVIFFTGKFFRSIRSKILSHKGRRINTLKIRNYELFNAGQLVRFLVLINNVLKWIVILILVYLALPILFGIFPWTKNFAATLIHYFTGPLKKIFYSIWNYLPDLFTIVVIVIFFRYLLKAFRFLKYEIEKGALKLPGFYADWANPTYQIVRVLVLAFMVVVIFPYLPGSDSQIFKGVSVFLGVLFTFGSAGALGNIVAGLVLTYMRAFTIGDRVQIGDAVGDIIEKTLLVTRVRTIKNEIISIPNSTVMGSHTINFSREAAEKGLILHTTVTIGYDSPWRQIHQLLTDAASATEMIDKEPPPFVLQTSLDDFYVSYQLNAYIRQPSRQAAIYSQLHQNIQDKFNEAGVEIMSPHYKSLRDGNKTTIPPNYLPEDYIAPSFGVREKKTGE